MLCNPSNSNKYFSSSSKSLTADVSTCFRSFWKVLILISSSFYNLSSVIDLDCIAFLHSRSSLFHLLFKSISSLRQLIFVQSVNSFLFRFTVCVLFTFLFILVLSSNLLAFKTLIKLLIKFNFFTCILYNSLININKPCSLCIFQDLSLSNSWRQNSFLFWICFYFANFSYLFKFVAVIFRCIFLFL